MTSELDESELGTQAFWDNQYRCEIENFHNHGDVGEIWFGEESTERICKWIDWLVNEKHIGKDSKIIDLGTGNGILPLELAKRNYTNLTGVDYSNDAIKLAQIIAQKENAQITYKVCDILNINNEWSKFDLVHDKGTYDAISLSQDAKNNREIYINNVVSMLRDNGIFVITSCNWTKDELKMHFTGKFELVKEIPTPQFKFGGQTGNTVTSLIFQRK